jgi:hypothetical protein
MNEKTFERHSCLTSLCACCFYCFTEATFGRLVLSFMYALVIYLLELVVVVDTVAVAKSAFRVSVRISIVLIVFFSTPDVNQTT